MIIILNCHTFTTASAPSGTGAPVDIFTIVPFVRTKSEILPILTVPITG